MAATNQRTHPSLLRDRCSWYADPHLGYFSPKNGSCVVATRVLLYESPPSANSTGRGCGEQEARRSTTAERKENRSKKQGGRRVCKCSTLTAGRGRTCAHHSRFVVHLHEARRRCSRAAASPSRSGRADANPCRNFRSNSGGSDYEAWRRWTRMAPPSPDRSRPGRGHCLREEHGIESAGRGVRARGDRRRQAGARELPAGHALLRQAGGRVRLEDRGRGRHDRSPCPWTGGELGRGSFVLCGAPGTLYRSRSTA